MYSTIMDSSQGDDVFDDIQARVGPNGPNKNKDEPDQESHQNP
jgi:hypothetical protein